MTTKFKTLTLNSIKIALLSVVFLAVALSFAACGGKTTLWSADFTKGNQDIFGIYGNVADNQDGTITLSSNKGQNYSASTYFGQEGKNYAWNEGGLSVNLTLKVDTETLTNGEYFVWSLALNELDGTYLTELPVFFIGTESGVKFLYKFTAVDSDYAALAQEESAVSLTSGTYTVAYNFETQKNGEIELQVVLKNSKGKQVYASQASTFTVINPTIHEGKDYTSETVVKEDMVKGLRYLWLVRNSVDVVVSDLSITE